MNKTAVGVGVGVGSVMAGAAWYFMRTQDRLSLIQLLTDDQKIPVLRAVAPFYPVPRKLELIADGKFEEYAEERISFFDSTSPKKVYEETSRGVNAFIASIPDATLSRIFDSLGISSGLVSKIKDVLKLVGVEGGGTSGQNRPR